MPPLSVASHALWEAYVAQDRPLYDEASGLLDLAVLRSLLEDRHDARTIEEKRRRVVEDARSHRRTRSAVSTQPRENPGFFDFGGPYLGPFGADVAPFLDRVSTRPRDPDTKVAPIDSYKVMLK